MAKRTSKNAQPQEPKKMLDSKSGISITPPDHIQESLFRRNGLWYHSIYCCNSADPHWGVVMSASLLSEQPCSGGHGGGGLHALAKTLGANKVQVIEYEDETLPHHKTRWTVAAIDSLYQTPAGVASVVASKCSLICKWNCRVSFLNNDLRNRTFDLHIFAHAVPYLTASDPTEKTYLFALADGCNVDNEQSDKFQLKNLKDAGVVDDYPIFVGITKFELYYKEKGDNTPRPKPFWVPVVVISAK